jgi:hypothetical protein
MLGLSLTVGLTLTTVTSCSDDDNIMAEVVVPEDANLLQLDSWSYEILFDIQSDSEWQIETTGDICYAYPDAGTGNATVKLCIVDNDDELSRTGELHVIFPKDTSKNRTYQLKQLGEADYGDNAVSITLGNRIYAVGYSYNANAGYASVNAVKKPILRFVKAVNDETIVFGPTNATFDIQTYTGSSISKISSDLATKAHLSGKEGGFTGEIKASFDYNTFNSNNYEYALTYINMAIMTVDCEANLSQMRDSNQYMLPEAYKAINGLDPVYAGVSGIKKLVKDYGTHMVVRSKMGGRLTYSMWLDISKITSAYDIKAYAEASYKTKVASLDMGASADETYKKSYEENSSKCNKKLAVLGGNRNLAIKLSEDFSEANLNAWRESLSESTMALVDFGDDDSDASLIALYELVDETKYPERYAEFQAYMEGEEIAQDYPSIAMTYDCGTAAKITIPTFSQDSRSSLIKEVRVEGQAVAEICEEYIPLINKQSRVTVVYPILNNKTYYNMGYFLGNASHQPARVSWVDDDLTITAYSDEAYGANEIIYIKGSNITRTAPDGTVFEGEVLDKTMTGTKSVPYLQSDGSYWYFYPLKEDMEIVYNYPLVKIFNHVWTRENHQSCRLNTGDRLIISGDGDDVSPYSEDGRKSRAVHYKDTLYYVLNAAADKYFAPLGWRVASASDYRTVQSILVDNGFSAPALALNSEGVTGFEAEYSGWFYTFKLHPNYPIGAPNWSLLQYVYKKSSEQAEYVTSDSCHVTLTKSGSMSVEETDDMYARSVRMVQE